MPERPDDLVILTSAASEIQASLYASILNSAGIDAIGPNAAATTLRWEVSSSDPYRVYVRRADLTRAREVLSRERADSVDIDWNEIDVGEPEHGAPGAGEAHEPAHTAPRFGWFWLVLLGIIGILIVFRAISLAGFP